jgi:hypothetical protein
MSDINNTIVLVFAGGKGTRWGNTTNKVLVDVNGEPLVVRVVRLAQQVFDCPVVVATQYDDVAGVVTNSDTPTFPPLPNRWLSEALLSTRSLWRERTIVLLGDTYYTEKCLNLIKHTDKLVCYFGRLLEIYAVSFRYHLTMERACEAAIASAEVSQKLDHEKGKLWHTYYALNRYSMDEHTIPKPGDSRFLRLPDDDITMDIDKPEDYKNLLEKIK